jgi:DNA mismatch repair protein MutL
MPHDASGQIMTSNHQTQTTKTKTPNTKHQTPNTMSQIRILPEILSNKIAAGEVVERPASVVKELLENALDAGATRIFVEVEKGGRSLIHISDNGSGMSRDDALLSIERYATSKIYSQEDLFFIKTLGFRGEALPSIASVSRFTLVTRDQESDSGTEIRIDGGKITGVFEVGAPVGTMVEVKQLFFNTPARRKFLKSIATEMGHIADIVSSMALGHSQVQIKLHHNGRVVRDWMGTSQPYERVCDVLGKEPHTKLYRVKHEDPCLMLDGWIGSSELTRTPSRGIYIFVNRRMVKDRVIQHALYEGYAGRIMKGQFPMAVLFLEVPHDTLDVNVHPTKNEVRFAHSKDIHAAVKRAVAEALAQGGALNWGGESFSKMPAASAVSEKKAGFDAAATAARPGVSLPAEERNRQAASGSSPGEVSQDSGSNLPGPPRMPFSEKPPALFQASQAASLQAELWGKKRFADLKVVGQFQDAYILCEAGEDLVMIDQHAAHERIRYEHLKKHRAAQLESQGLLMPDSIDFGYREAKVLEKVMPELEQLGFKIEHFGGETYRIQSVPALFKNSDAKALIIEIVEKWIETGFEEITQRAMDDTLKLMACHSAVRANQRLTDSEIKALLSQLDACDQPSHCPHGRPTWIRLERRFIEKLFKRIV